MFLQVQVGNISTAVYSYNSLIGLHVNHISRTNIVTIASLLAIACKARSSLHCDGKKANVDIMRLSLFRNHESSYFHSQAFIFMRFSSLAMPWIAIFARKCDCHAMVNSLAIERIAISIRNLRLSSSRLHATPAKPKAEETLHHWSRAQRAFHWSRAQRAFHESLSKLL